MKLSLERLLMSDFTSPADEAFLGAIGRLTISWGHLEVGLDGMVSVMQPLHGHRIDAVSLDYPERLDQLLRCELSRKVRYLREVFQEVPIPQCSIDSFLSFLHQVSSKWDKRHNVIHGCVVKWIQDSGKACLTRRIKKKGRLHATYYNMTTEDILKAAIQVQKLADKAFLFLEEFDNLMDDIKEATSSSRKTSDLRV